MSLTVRGQASPGPAASTPTRRVPSVRRTTTHDSLRPRGLLGPVSVEVRGRDLLTGADGVAQVLDTSRLELEVDYPERTIQKISMDRPDGRLQALVGRKVSSGFRRAVAEAMPEEQGSHSLRFQLLDDLPTALLVSGYAIYATGTKMKATKGPVLQVPDLCAGWVTGGMLLTTRDEDGLPPSRRGPVAPAVEPDDDRLAWHETDPLPPSAMRRRRRLDIWKEGNIAMIDSWFRDSYVDPDGVETVVHEYTVHASADTVTSQFLSCRADFGALPWPECPNALASAGRIVGAPVDGLRRWVADTFTGPTTCTHLNDTLRSLEDVGGLLKALAATGES